MITPRENRLRALEYRYPEWIPCSLNTLPIYWYVYGDALGELAKRHPNVYRERDLVKPDMELGRLPEKMQPGYEYRDEWGILQKVGFGTAGPVSIEHPLADWDALKSYQPPDPLAGHDWDQEAKQIAEARAAGQLAEGNGGDLFTRMLALRGFENMMMDFATGDPHLEMAFDMLVEHDLALVNKYLSLGADMIRFHNDLGWQQSLAISPAMFRRYLKPRFQKLMLPCREAGAHVFLSSDGYMLDIVDDLIECGVSCHDPQVSANTLEGIKRAYKGKMCVRIRLDPQALPFCSPADVREMVRQAVEAMGDPAGGLWLDCNLCTDDVPMANLEAICQAYEEFCF